MIVRFDRFELDCGDRRLRRDGAPVDLNARYFDALALLVRQAGTLVSKERFLGDVWGGVPVTDEALTQCIKTLRNRLGDDAARPRFIETVPKHGYRFVAAVTEAEVAQAAGPIPQEWRVVARIGGAATAGAGVAGVVGGLIYGLAGAMPGGGAVSGLLVLVCLTALIALLGGAGVGFGIAVMHGRGWWQCTLGGAAGGLVVGAMFKLVGVDAFDLLLGRSPGAITGAAEGLALGGAVGLASWVARNASPRRGFAIAALGGSVAGMLIPLLGGHMLGGSLALLAGRFPASRLRLDRIGALVGDPAFGMVGQGITGALEGGLFGGCLVGATLWMRRR